MLEKRQSNIIGYSKKLTSTLLGYVALMTIDISQTSFTEIIHIVTCISTMTVTLHLWATS